MSVVVDQHGPVRVVTLDRPERRNALTPSMLAVLHERLEEADVDEATAAIVLTGRDPAFCAGLDLDALQADDELLSAVDPSVGAPSEAPRRTPLIAAVNGPAATGGLELVLGCDLVIASERASFADTHARVGVVPAGGMTVHLPRAVGLRLALDMSLTGRWLTAPEALAAGLVSRVVPHEHLLDEALAVADRIASSSASVLGAIRALHRRSLDGTVGDAVARERAAFAEWRARSESVHDVRTP